MAARAWTCGKSSAACRVRHRECYGLRARRLSGNDAQLARLRAAHGEARAVLQLGDHIAIEFAPERCDVIEIDDMRAVNAHETLRIQPQFELRQRQVQHVLRSTGMSDTGVRGT